MKPNLLIASLLFKTRLLRPILRGEVWGSTPVVLQVINLKIGVSLVESTYTSLRARLKSDLPTPHSILTNIQM